MFSMKLTPIAERFILHWGEMGTKWGVNRTVAQIHALLFFYGRPMHAEEITDTLSVARSNVSNCLKELQNWNLIHVVHIIGDRAAEIVHIGQVVLAMGGTIEYFRDAVFNYPTLAEAFKVAALDGLNKL